MTPEELRLRAYVAASDDVFWTVGPLGDACSVSQAWMNTTGQSMAETRGWGWLEAIHPDDRERVRAAWHEAIERRTPWEIELRLRGAGGRHRLVHSRIVPVFREPGGELVEWMGTFEDITAARRAESLLTEQNRILELISRDAPLRVTLDALMRTIEAHVEGLRCSVLLLRDGRLWNAAAPNLPGEYLDAIEGIAIGPEVGSCGSAAFLGRAVVSDDIASDPRWAPVRDLALKYDLRSCRSTPIRSGDGEILGTFAMYHRGDYQADGPDEDLVGVATHLASIAIERERHRGALQRRNEELADEARRKDEFLAQLGHELRNPLAAVVNAVELLEQGQAAPPVVAVAARVLGRQARMLNRLVDDLLDVSRVTRGKNHLARRLVDVRTIVDTALESVEPMIREQHHQLVLRLPSSPLQLDADPTRLAQALSNLLSNAAKYTPPGGRITLTVDPHGDQVTLSVVDTGIGLERDRLASVFELFVQDNRSRGQFRGGLGIGLAIVKSLVELHGGTTWARSDGPGMGSEFVIRLPLHVASRPEGPPPTSAAKASTGARAQEPTPQRSRVLIVDDNRDAAEVLAEALRLAGHEVRTAADGASALSIIDGVRPTATLLDIGLPDINGYELARRIRALPGCRSMPLFALTGYGQAEDRAHALEAGFDRHLTKPVELGALLSLLRGGG